MKGLIISAGFLFLAGVSTVHAQSATIPIASDQPIEKTHVCIWNSQLFSIGATFCIGPRVAVECKDVANNDARWFVNTDPNVGRRCDKAALP